ncbi:MAG: C25 family cysteine peptidase, partial [bacterium]
MKRTFLFILFFLSATYSIELEFQLGPPSFKIVHTDSLTNIELENGVIFSRPGEFELPVLVYHFIAPQNTRVSKLIYEELGDTIISNINLPVLPLLSPDFQEYKTKITQTPSDSFPKERVKLVADGAISGSHIISVMVSPFVYYPQKNELRVIKGYHIKCELEPYSFELVKPYRLTPIGKIHFENLINSLVYNKADIKLYGYNAEPNLSTNISRMTIPPDINDGSLDFVIITPDSFAPILDTLEMLELRLGLSGKVVLVSEIDSYYHGADIIEKIRKFLVDAHRQWGIWAVIIAGDFNNIPLRACSGVDQLGQITSVPALFYYLQLDGSFNSDRDALFGEDASDDLFPELIGGILPFENRTEFIGYINKMRNYIYSIGREYCSRWVFAGASLTRESGEYTGQAAKEMILRRYTIPDGINVIRLYSYASSTGGDYELNRETFLNQIENGTIFINHIDHSSRLTLGTGYKVTGELLTISDIDSLSNEPNFPLLFTFSCHSTDPVLDNISRHWVMNRGGGGIGFIGTSGAVWTTQIFSDQYFIESLIQPYSLIGEIYTNFLMRIIPDRYLIYTYLLNGNPLVDFYFPGGPESLYVERPDSIPNNISTFNIRFYGRDGSAADGVRVVAVDAYGWRSSGITDESGVATLSIRSPELGFVKIYAASSRSLPFEDSIRIYATTSPRPFITHWKIHDDTTGIPRSGFEAFIDLTVKNYGLGRGNISIIGNALSFGLIMLDSTENISSPLSTGESLFVPNALSFVNDTFSGKRQFSIELTLESNGNIYKDTITFTAYGPIIKVVSVRYIDTLYGNGDFMPDPGERGEISLLVVNEGKGTLQNGRMELAPYDSDITILSDSFFVSELAES